VIGYNPKKPGRPSHSYHTYSMAGVRLVLDVDVVAATSTHPNISRPACGRCSIASRVICGISVAWRLRVRQRADHARSGTARLAYLFKLRLTANVKRMIERLSTQREWANTARLQAKESLLRLEGEQAAPRDHIAAAGEGRLGDIFE